MYVCIVLAVVERVLFLYRVTLKLLNDKLVIIARSRWSFWIIFIFSSRNSLRRWGDFWLFGGSDVTNCNITWHWLPLCRFREIFRSPVFLGGAIGMSPPFSRVPAEPGGREPWRGLIFLRPIFKKIFRHKNRNLDSVAGNSFPFFLCTSFRVSWPYW
jgi:hypothetical protein